MFYWVMTVLKSQYAVIDHGRELFRGVAYIPFQSLPPLCVVVLKSSVHLPAGSAVQVKAELVGNDCELVLFGGTTAS